VIMKIPEQMGTDATLIVFLRSVATIRYSLEKLVKMAIPNQVMAAIQNV